MAQKVSALSEYEEIIAGAGSKFVAVDFSAEWCGPCRAIGPKFENFASKYADGIFLKVDVDEASEIAEKYRIKCMPTFHFFKGGKMVKEFSGASEETLKKTLDDVSAM